MPLRRVAPGRLAALALVVLTACGGGDESPTIEAGESPTSTVVPAPAGTSPATGTVLSVNVRGGSVEGASRQRAPLNQPVTIRVTSDVADEVHVHGYDKRASVTAGSSVDINFVANIPGVFEVEFERSRKLLFTLEVR